MIKSSLPLLVALGSALPAVAEDKRHVDAHEHGVGQLNIAVDGTNISAEFTAPGADIVGFEHEATSDEDKLAVKNAIEALTTPRALFLLPDAAGCTVVEASAEVHGGGHEDHDDHEDHEEAHDHDEHAEHEEDHDHDTHDDHEEGHDDHEEAGTHNEFHVEYSLTCDNPAEITSVEFPYFEAFENAKELEVQIAGPSGVKAFEVTRDAPKLDLKGAL